MTKPVVRRTLSALPQRGLRIAILISLLVVSLAGASAAQPIQDESKSVLIFDSYDPTLTGATLMNDAIRTTIRTRSSVRVQFYRESMDSTRIPESKYEDL